MLPSLQVGPLALQVPGLILILGLWLGLSLVERRDPRYGVHPASLYNLVLIGLISGILGARLTYAARYPSAFIASPGSLVSLSPGLLDPLGGAGLAFIAVMVYVQRKGLPFWPLLDALTPLLAVMGVAIGLAHLASGEAFGAPADLPWAITMWGAQRHPSQVYETLLAALILFTLLQPGIAHRLAAPGLTFLVFLSMTAGARLFLEAFRGDSALVAGGLRVAQLLSWSVLAVCLWVISRMIAEKKEETNE